MNSKSGLFTRLKVCLQLLALCAALPAGAQHTYYIATNGNNAWSGMSSNFVSGTNGPWQTFKNIGFGGSPGLSPGDVVYVRGGVYNHANDSYTTALSLSSVYGTPSSPIVISNYPGETVIISNSGPDAPTIFLNHAAWIKIFGINSTNAYRGVTMLFITNCEVAYCDFGGGNTNYGWSAPCTVYSSSQSNWFHNLVVHDALSSQYQDGSKNFTFGQFYGTNDFTAYNLIESNICYHGGHDTLSCYGPSNVIRYNWVHNEPWEYRYDCQLECGHRCVELGGTIGNYNLFENNWLSHAGIVPDAGSHAIEGSDISYEIIRNNVMVSCAYSGLTIYGGKVNGVLGGTNYVYNNTIAYNGFGQRYVTNFLVTSFVVTNIADSELYTLTIQSVNTNIITGTNDNNVWRPGADIANTYGNIIVNNLLWDNNTNVDAKNSGFNFFQGASNISLFVNNMTNVDPQFINTNDGGPWQMILPNCRLQPSSPAIDAGTWLTTITSSSGTGTNFSVVDANYFFAGMTAAGHTIAGDTIQLQGATNTAVITAISSNMITINAPLTWTTGLGVALPYGGNAPDIGAYEYYAVSSPTNLQIISPP